MITVTEPGIYEMTAEDYHRDPVPGGSLSSSGARRLLPPGCPALYRWEQDNPQPAKKTFDYGHAAHKLVLDEGPELVVVDAPLWNTDAIRAEVAAIRAEGGIPLKKHEYDQIEEMAAAIRRHPVAGALFRPGTGVAEESIFWQDPATGIWLRCRPDWRRPGVIVDYKTTTDAAPSAVAKAIDTYGYHQQDPFYTDGAAAVGLGDHRFLFAFQAKNPPYLVTVVELDDEARRIGAAKNRRAIEIYAQCQADGKWPDWHGDLTEIPYLSLPRYAAIRDTEEYLT
ncbi:PD-(D/E)XK nuclease-like domain-containing protein [Streptomyces sp. NPDC086989]|uniref:PD-(D/E)XK nuclease-like domain-containing protein n=1 Tax=Streptomyces sp. NPDC086989 TaxID=3365764 RepID=UPI0037FF56D7